MKIERIDKYTRGYFVGDFEPAIVKTNKVEIAIQRYKNGEYEERHYHKVAKEITVILEGRVRINDSIEVSEGDIIVIDPNEDMDFLPVTDVTTLVVKIPGAKDDKFMGVYNA
jgi:quercetin dioxygenase-like cupin family protein